jgi:hypothetical protein
MKEQFDFAFLLHLQNVQVELDEHFTFNYSKFDYSKTNYSISSYVKNPLDYFMLTIHPKGPNFITVIEVIKVDLMIKINRRS